MTAESLAYFDEKRVSGVTFQQFLNKEIGVFETMRPVAGVIRGLSYHLERLENGAIRLALPTPPITRICRMLKELAVGASGQGALLRVLVVKNGWYLFLDPWVDVWAGKRAVSLMTVVAERQNPEVKSCLAQASLSARESAELAGYDEALLVDRSGHVREGAWSNIFYIDRQNVLVTPATKILPGITRRIVLMQASSAMQVSERDFVLDEMLAEAKEIFITQATRGIVAVSRINHHEFDEAMLTTKHLKGALARYDLAE